MQRPIHPHDSTPVALQADPLARLAGIRHGFFTRAGGEPDPAGANGGIYTGLNCGLGSNDDPVRVGANRAHVARALGAAPGALVTVAQVHSADVVHVTEPWVAGAAPKVDAAVTARPGIALGILTADCAPVLFADPDAGVIGAAHAGWRGALGGVLGATVAAMQTLGAHPRRIVAAIGPAIARASYEVGPELRTAFVTVDADHGRFFVPGRADRWHFDLAGFCADALARAGVGEVADLALDTLADADRFFSYRRGTLAGAPDYGRQISAIIRN